MHGLDIIDYDAHKNHILMNLYPFQAGKLLNRIFTRYQEKAGLVIVGIGIFPVAPLRKM
jgi:hypothetical protein